MLLEDATHISKWINHTSLYIMIIRAVTAVFLFYRQKGPEKKLIIITIIEYIYINCHYATNAVFFVKNVNDRIIIMMIRRWWWRRRRRNIYVNNISIYCGIFFFLDKLKNNKKNR